MAVPEAGFICRTPSGRRESAHLPLDLVSFLPILKKSNNTSLCFSGCICWFVQIHSGKACSVSCSPRYHVAGPSLPRSWRRRRGTHSPPSRPESRGVTPLPVGEHQPFPSFGTEPAAAGLEWPHSPLRPAFLQHLSGASGTWTPKGARGRTLTWTPSCIQCLSSSHPYLAGSSLACTPPSP